MPLIFNAHFTGKGGLALKEKQTSGKALAEAAQAYLEAHSAEKFSLEEIAKALYVNGSYLLRAFKRYTGVTPLSYHHQLRCEKAKALLAQTELTVSQVGEAAGFVSSSHFSHIFRKTVGCSPSEYRRRRQSNGRERTET